MHSAKIVQGPWPLLFPHLNTPQLLLWRFTWERQGGKREETFLHKIVLLTSLPARSAVSSDGVAGVLVLVLDFILLEKPHKFSCGKKKSYTEGTVTGNTMTVSAYIEI